MNVKSARVERQEQILTVDRAYSNMKTETFVGSTCIKIFRTRLESVMIVYNKLLNARGIQGKLHGITKDEDPKFGVG